MNRIKTFFSLTGIQGRRQAFRRHFFALFLIMIMLLSLMFYYLYAQKTSQELNKLREEEKYKLLHIKRQINLKIRVLFSDLMHIAHEYELKQYINTGSLISRKNLEREWKNICLVKKVYDQIRFLDNRGNEKLRVNYHGGKPRIVPQKNLQNKSGRYYFKESILLKDREIYVSPLDLNIEKGQVERPLKPMIRLGTPVVRKNNKVAGIVVLNFLGADILTLLDKEKTSKNTVSMLLNRKGYWLYNSRKQKEWGFMFNHQGHTLGNSDPGAWQQILRRDTGQFQNSRGLYTFVTILPFLSVETLSSNRDMASSTKRWKRKFWKLVSFVPKTARLPGIAAFERNLLIIFFSLIILAAIGIRAYVIAAIRRAVYQEKLKQSIADKENLVREAYHRVKNNLAVVQSLLSLQSLKVEDKQAKGMFHESENRVASMAVVHELLYKSTSLADLDFSTYIRKLAEMLYKNYQVNMQGVSLRLDIDEVSLDVDTIIPCGLILNELITNAFKYAFPQGQEGYVRISVKKTDEERIRLVVKDNGTGLPDGYDQNSADSMGMQIIRILTKQIDGELEWLRGEGTEVRLTF